MNFKCATRLVPVVIILGTMMFSSCGNRGGGLPQNNQFPVATAATANAEMNNAYPAVIKGRQDVEIRPKVSGFITRLCVEEGSSVRAGQVLVTIDNVQYKAALNQAEAALASAKSALATAELTYKNKQELHSQNIIGDYDLQTAENNLSTAKAALSQNGVIGTIPYRVGSLVSSSIATPLTTVSNIEQMYVYFSMTEKQLLEMTREKGKDVAAAFPAVQLQLADGSMYEHPGKVQVVSGVIDQATGSVSVRADFSNPDHLLKSGGTGSVIIPSKAENVIVIPQSATMEVQNKVFVYTVGKDNKVKHTEIKVNPRNDGTTYVVTEGLAVGDRFVTTGLTKLSDGMEITPVTEAEYKKNIEEAQKLGSIQGDYKKMKEAFSKK